MNYWRMKCRCGKSGSEMWEKCLEIGVASITCHPFIDFDLSKNTPLKHKEEWEMFAPSQRESLERFPPQRESLERFLYDCTIGDIIFMEQGEYIVGRGVISGNYKLVKRTTLIYPEKKVPWCYNIPVKWDKDFLPIKLLLRSEQFIVIPLESSQINLINRAEKKAKGQDKKLEVIERKYSKVEINFKKRNRAKIEAKKLISNGNCGICGFNFSKFYQGLSKNHLIPHHLYDIKSRETKLEDIALVCPNCYTAIHSENPIIKIKGLRNRLKMNYN